jgi:hypothetical protein
MSNKLRTLWIKPTIDAVWVSQNPWDHWGNTGKTFNLGQFKENRPRAVLISRGEVRNTFMKVWLYTGYNLDHLITPETREQWAFWINPLWLKELPV